MICVKCGEAMRMTEKDTSSGRDIREYVCPGCGYSDWEDNGAALWKILSDDREEAEAERAARPACDCEDGQAEISATKNPPGTSMWSRLLARLGR